MGWQHIQFEDGSNPYICKTEDEFDRMQKKYNLEQIKKGVWLAREYKAISDWLEVEYREITEDMKEYTRDEEDWIQPGFEWNGEFHFLSDFVRTHNNPWGEIGAPDYIHGYDSTNIFRPLFIEINDSSEEVRLYEHMNRSKKLNKIK